jgi:hypothetical protein
LRIFGGFEGLDIGFDFPIFEVKGNGSIKAACFLKLPAILA